MPDLKRLEEIAKELNAISVELMGDKVTGKCVHAPGMPCTEREDKRVGSAGFHSYDPIRMCEGCALYWHASCAQAQAFFLLKKLRWLEVEQEREASK